MSSKTAQYSFIGGLIRWRNGQRALSGAVKVVISCLCLIGTCLAQSSSNSSPSESTQGSDSSGSNGSKGKAAGDSADSSGQNNPLVFGNVKISTQPSAEVTTIGYDITAHLATRIADSILVSLSAPSIKKFDPKGVITPSASFKILVVNDKTTADHLRVYRTMISQIDYVIDQGNVADSVFQSQAKRAGSIKIQPTNDQLQTILSVNKLLDEKNYPPQYQIVLDAPLKIKLAVKDALASTTAASDEKLTSNNTEWHSFSFLLDTMRMLPQEAADLHISSDSSASKLNASANGPGGSATIPSSYAVPYIGQAQATVDAVTGLGQSIAKFYSLFRSNDDINGVSLKVSSEALTALVIKRLKIGQARKNCEVHCYYSDLLAGNATSSGIMDKLNQLLIIADKVTKDLARVDPQTGIVPDNGVALPPTALSTDQGEDALDAYAMFAQTTPTFVAATPPPGGTDLTGQKGKIDANNKYSALQKQLQAYGKSVTQIFAMLYGTTGTGKSGQNTADDGENDGTTKVQNPSTDFSGTNQNQNVAAPITITPTISPQITINANGTAPSGGNGTNGGKTSGAKSTPAQGSNSQSESANSSDGSVGSTAEQSSSAVNTPPLAAILQDEEMHDLRADGYLLYLNILSAAGANKTENGWWSSDMLSNAGVAVDFFLVDQNGEVIDSSAENGQSPYLPAVGRGWAERLPTIVTTDRNVKTKTDIWESDDTEPQSRFTVTPVVQKSADENENPTSSDYSYQGTKAQH